MARRVFCSFHYEPDCSCAAQVRNMGVVEGNKPANDNEWERITRGGAAAIRRWIERELDGKSCNVVLIGENTAGRRWINYEIKEAWNSKKGVVGVYIHRLRDLDGNQSAKGDNPLEHFRLDGSNKKLWAIVKAYNPPYTNSKDVYAYIKDNLFDWIEEAIEIRQVEG
jgi:hypothetical protein